MADKKISDLTPVTTLASGDLFELETAGGNSRKITFANLSPGWVLNQSWTFSVNVASVAFTGLAGVQQMLILCDGVTLSVSGVPLLQVSTNNGSSYYSASGDYKAIDSAGTSVNTTGVAFTGASATAARWGTVHVYAPHITGMPRIMAEFPSTSTPLRLFTADNANDIDAVQVVPSAGGNLTGGSIWVLTR